MQCSVNCRVCLGERSAAKKPHLKHHPPLQTPPRWPALKRHPHPTALPSNLTSAQLQVLILVDLHLRPILARLLGGAAVALPLQDVADEDAQQAEQEEDGHQAEGDVLCLGVTGPGPGPARGSVAVHPGVCSLVHCTGEEEDTMAATCGEGRARITGSGWEAR